MRVGGRPQPTKRQLRTLMLLHELRNVLYHDSRAHTPLKQDSCLRFIRDVIAFARQYGVETPQLVPPNLDLIEPVQILVPFDPSPARFPADLRQLAVAYCRKREILAGLIENIGWPLVRCCLCESLVSMDCAAITQEDVMSDYEDEEIELSFDCIDTEPPRPYCYYGCAKAHQRMMQEELGDEAAITFSTEYYLQPLMEQMPGVLENRWPGLRVLPFER